MNSTNEIHLMQWNILSRSEIFCSKEAFPNVEESNLNWFYRATLFKKIFYAINPDLICLQEVDDYNELKDNIISDTKYNSIYFKKNEGVQGIAIFYDKEKFNLLYFEKVNLPKDDNGTESSHVFIYSFLEHKQTSKVICLISTHLKAKTQFEEVRLSQVKFMLDFIDRNEKFLGYIKDLDTKAVILCGDLNAEPQYSCIKYIEQYIFQVNPPLLNSTLISGYNYTDPSKEDYLEMTTFKIRDKEYYRIIDYIFYSNFVNKIKVTPTMKKDEFKLYEKDITSTGLPSSFFPSDHYYLNLVFNI